MSITVNTNMPSLISQKSLLNATNSMNTALQRMSTGYRINSSKDDAAGMAISNKFEYKTSSYKVANDNAQMGQSMLETANGSLSNINSMLQRMRDLTEQAANGTYGDDERNAMQMEINALTEEIYRVKNTTEFNGKNLFSVETSPNTKIPAPELKPFTPTTPTVSMADVSVNDWDSTENQIIGISSAQELLKLSVNKLDTINRTFVLTSDIDLNDLGDLDGNGSNWIPIQYLDNLAVFDGNGHTISNMKIVNYQSANKYTGFFEESFGATVKNIKFENVSIEGTEGIIGTIVGNDDGSTFENCVVSNANLVLENKTGTDSKTSLGGFVGQGVTPKIRDCYFEGNLTNKNAVGVFTGGFIGDAVDSNIVDSDVVVNITTRDNLDLDVNDSSTFSCVGGLLGGSSFGVVGCWPVNCSVKGTIDSNAGLVGGLIGICGGDFYNCEIGVDMTVSSDSNDYVGSMIGFMYDGSSYDNITYKNGTTTSGAKLPIVGGSNGHLYAGQIEQNSNISNVTTPGSTQVYYKKCNLQVGINNDENSVLQVDTNFDLGLFSVSVMTDDSARNSLTKIDELMEKVTNKMTEIGAIQNRLESVIEAQETQIMTMSSANSLIKDADIAEESSSYIKSQILQQTTASLLATANQCPSIALQLV